MSLDLSGFVQKKTTIKIGTKDFTFSELTLGDLGRFRGELIEQRKKINAGRRERLIKDAKLIEGIDPMELLKLTDISISEEELEAEMETIEGIKQLALFSLTYAHPGISLDDVEKIVSINSMEKVSDAMFPSDEKEKRTQKVLLLCSDIPTKELDKYEFILKKGKKKPRTGQPEKK